MNKILGCFNITVALAGIRLRINNLFRRYRNWWCHFENPETANAALQGQKRDFTLASGSKTLRQFIHIAPISHCWVGFHRSVTFTSWNAWGGRIVFHVYSKEFTWEPTENQKPRIQRTWTSVWYRLKESGFRIWVDAWKDVSWKRVKGERSNSQVTGSSGSCRKTSYYRIFWVIVHLTY